MGEVVRMVPAAFEHREQWARLRAMLWDEPSTDEHQADIVRQLKEPARFCCFVARRDAGDIVGFAEASLRQDYVNGCATSPVAFLEGLFVRADHRRRGIATMLCAEVASWGKSLGCTEFASDALLDNHDGHRFHAALGFAETERVVYFNRAI